MKLLIYWKTNISKIVILPPRNQLLIRDKPVIRIIKGQTFHPYKIMVFQKLVEGNPGRRLCEIIIDLLNMNYVNAQNILFSDESMSGQGLLVIDQHSLKGLITNYSEFLQEQLILHLVVMFPDPDEANIPNRNIQFHQDGAPTHFGRSGISGCSHFQQMDQ